MTGLLILLGIVALAVALLAHRTPDDTTLVSACDEPTIVERPPWADESRVSAAAKLGGRRR